MKYLLILLLAGCSTIDKQVEGFPQDLIIEHRIVSRGEVFSHCWQYLTTIQKVLLSIPLACAEIDLDAKTCVITRPEDLSQDIRDHEESHCRGGDHDGILQAYFDQWQLSRRKE